MASQSWPCRMAMTPATAAAINMMKTRSSVPIGKNRPPTVSKASIVSSGRAASVSEMVYSCGLAASNARSRSFHKSEASSKPTYRRTRRGDTPKSTAALGEPAWLIDISAGMTRLSCPPQLTPSLKKFRALQNVGMSNESSASKLKSPPYPLSSDCGCGCSPGWYTRFTDGCATAFPPESDRSDEIAPSAAARSSGLLTAERLPGRTVWRPDTLSSQHQVINEISASYHCAGHNIAVAGEVLVAECMTRSIPAASGC